MQRTLSIANFFIKESNYTVTPLQLVKLVYISYGYVLAIVEEELFSEDIEAWQFGPVIPSVYHTFKHYKRNKITELSTELTFDDDFSFNEQKYEIENNENSKIVIQILKAVWSHYKRYTAFQLIDLTHKSGTPWVDVYNPDEHHTKIEPDAIKVYYNNLVG
jgi:uncharacterized phage-associated protein